ncbi:hypothetical protein AVEN_96043-1 [Araneus ventricosus]|uniref:Uncharacterized protein n=1 Tax=Araneus ventricosus TaxID=182803 RepID=A0A4Y2B5S4_ARAVE|nr:hypothetical protein AVEN_96043-1 [Araneus ventricosus]
MQGHYCLSNRKSTLGLEDHGFQIRFRPRRICGSGERLIYIHSSNDFTSDWFGILENLFSEQVLTILYNHCSNLQIRSHNKTPAPSNRILDILNQIK